MADNISVAEYLNKMLAKKSETTQKILEIINELKELNIKAYEHHAKVVYSFQMPPEVTLLVFDLVLHQVRHGDNPNAMKMLQNLSRNQKQNFDMVYPEYKKCMLKYSTNPKATEDNQYITEIPISTDVMESAQTTQTTQTTQEEGNPSVDYLSSIDNDHIIINPMRVPKQGWLMKVYANSFEDYCKIVQDTIQDIIDNKMTIFLTKPESFQKKIAGHPFAVAYSVLVNDNFSFIKLNIKTIKRLDEDGIANPTDKVKISGRVYMDLVLFSAKKYMDAAGNILDSAKPIVSKIKDENEMMGMIEAIGTHDNIVQYYIEIMTGLPMQNNKQFYKSVIISSRDLNTITEIVKMFDVYNFDFVADTNQNDMKLLFVHKSHMRKLLKEIILRGISIQLNPSFDNLKIDENLL